jgi:hypothetical protein
MAGGSEHSGRHERPTAVVDEATPSERTSARSRYARFCAIGLLAIGLVVLTALAIFVFQDTAKSEDGTGMATGFTLIFFAPPWLTGTVLISASLGLLVWRPQKVSGYIVGTVLAALAIGVPALAAVVRFPLFLIFTRFGWVVMLWGVLLLAALLTSQFTDWTHTNDDTVPHE